MSPPSGKRLPTAGSNLGRGAPPRPPPAGPRARRGPRLFQHADVPRFADVLERLGPHRDGDLAEVGRPKQVHVGPGLPDAPADAQRDAVVEDGLMVRELEEILLA